MFAERKQAEEWQIIDQTHSALTDLGRGRSDSQFLSFQVQKGTIASPLQGVDLCFFICHGALSPAYKLSMLCCLLLSILCPSTFPLPSLLPSFSPLPSLPLPPSSFPLSPHPILSSCLPPLPFGSFHGTGDQIHGVGRAKQVLCYPRPHPGLSLFLMKNSGNSCRKRRSTQQPSAHPSTVLQEVTLEIT